MPEHIPDSKAWLVFIVCLFSLRAAAAEEARIVFDSVTLAPEITPVPTYHQNRDSNFLVDNGRRMANSLSVVSGSIRAGVLQYRNRQGKYRYGFGYRKMLGSTKLDAVLNKEGVLLAMNKDRLLYNLNISNHEPRSNTRAIFMQFSIQAYW